MLSKLIIKTMPLVPRSVVRIIANRYIAGEELSDAVKVTQDLMKMGACSTVDVLGEFVTSKERAIHEKGMSEKVLKAIKDNNLKTYLSVKPTSLGMGIDMDFGYENISYLVGRARELDIFVRLDMENSPFTTKTLDTYKRLRKDGYDNVGVVLQAYMRRSEDDIRSLLEYKPSVRLCKGIYIESEEIAYRKPDEIRDNYKKLLNLLLVNNFYTGIATHDDILLDYAREYIKQNKIPNDSFEFQMLLGVREEKRNEIIRQGYQIRIYVPFGKDWYGYSTRRMKENPQVAGHIFKAIFFKN